MTLPLTENGREIFKLGFFDPKPSYFVILEVPLPKKQGRLKIWKICIFVPTPNIINRSPIYNQFGETLIGTLLIGPPSTTSSEKH